ncbi:MAG: DUF3106 domain-containing protein [Arenimonas sp.]
MKTRGGQVFTVLLALLLSNSIQAQEKFEQLPAREQDLLKAGSNLWPQLDAKAKLQLRAQAQHWMTLSAAQQQTLLLRQRQWDSLSFGDKSKQRANLAAWQSLGAIDQTKISATYRQWQRLPIEKQQALKAKFSQQLPEYQQAWIFGPTLGKQAQALQEWIVFTPQEQIRPWLMLLRELSTEDRGVLINLGKRWNQQQRDTFRTRLLSAPTGARTEMVQSARF